MSGLHHSTGGFATITTDNLRLRLSGCSDDYHCTCQRFKQIFTIRLANLGSTMLAQIEGSVSGRMPDG